MKKNKNKTYVIDCGKNQATIYDGKTVITISHETLLSLPAELQRGDTVIGEYSHFGCPRKLLSKAQPFEAEKLLGWYERFREAGVNLKLFPQQSTPRACILVHGYKKDAEGKFLKESNGKNHIEKSDETDPIAIFNFLLKEPQGKRVSLMKPPTSFEEDALRTEGNEWKSDTNTIINSARSVDYEAPEDKNAEWLRDNAETISSRLSPRARNIFGYDNFYTTTDKKGRWTKGDLKNGKVNMVQVYPVLTVLRMPDGSLRERIRTHALPGWKFIKKYVFCMTPFHLKGGVARSNFYYHGLRAYVSRMSKTNEGFTFTEGKASYRNRGTFSPEEDVAYLKYRAEYCGAIKELFTLFKDMLQEKE